LEYLRLEALLKILRGNLKDQQRVGELVVMQRTGNAASHRGIASEPAKAARLALVITRDFLEQDYPSPPYRHAAGTEGALRRLAGALHGGKNHQLKVVLDRDEAFRSIRRAAEGNPRADGLVVVAGHGRQGLRYFVDRLQQQSAAFIDDPITILEIAAVENGRWHRSVTRWERALREALSRRFGPRGLPELLRHALSSRNLLLVVRDGNKNLQTMTPSEADGLREFLFQRTGELLREARRGPAETDRHSFWIVVPVEDAPEVGRKQSLWTRFKSFWIDGAEQATPIVALGPAMMSWGQRSHWPVFEAARLEWPAPEALEPQLLDLVKDVPVDLEPMNRVEKFMDRYKREWRGPPTYDFEQFAEQVAALAATDPRAPEPDQNGTS